MRLREIILLFSWLAMVSQELIAAPELVGRIDISEPGLLALLGAGFVLLGIFLRRRTDKTAK